MGRRLNRVQQPRGPSNPVLHPYRQYQGVRANFQRERETTYIPAFVHHISDFIDAAKHTGLILESFKEWWHAEDQNKLPRLVSFMFEKPK